MRYTITEGWQGCQVLRYEAGKRFPLVLRNIRKGKATWTTDYTFGGYYSRKTAEKNIERLQKGEYK